MAGGVKVGTGYIDIRLGDLSKFWGKLKGEVEKGGRQVGEKLGERVGRGIKVDRAALKQISDSVARVADEGGDEFRRKLRAKFLLAGRDGAEAVVQEFQPQFRHLIEQSGIDGKEALLRKLDAGNLGKQMSAQLANAFGAGIGAGLPQKAAQTGQSIGSSLASGIRSGVSRAAGAFGGLGEAVNRLGQRIGLLGFQIQNLGFTATAAVSGPIAALVGASAAIGIKTASTIEDAQIAFETLLGNEPQAKKFLRTLRDFANVSPVFDTSSVIEFSRKMLGAGISADKILPSLKALSSTAAAYGLNQDQINRALLGLTQSLLIGKVHTEELNQVNEAGIPIYDLLSRAMGKSKQELDKLLKSGKVTPEQVFAALVKLGNSGKFLEGLDKRAKTLSGTWAQFKETLSSRLADALLPQLPRIKQFLKDLGDALNIFLKNSGPLFDKLTSKFGDLGKSLKTLADRYDDLNPKQKDFIDKVILVSASVGPAVIAVGALATAVSGIISALGFVLTPAGLVVAAILGLGAAAIYAYNKSAELRGLIAGVGDVLTTFGEKVAQAWREHIMPALADVARIWEERLKPALSQLYAVLKDQLGPAAREFAAVAGGILAVALVVLADIIQNFVVPALALLAAYIQAHPKQFAFAITVILGAVAAFALLAAILVGVVIVAFGAVAVVVGSMIGIFLGIVYVIATVIGWLHSLADAIADVLGQSRRKVRDIGNAFQSLVGVVAGVVQAIIAAFGALPGALVDIGRNAVRGLVRGALGQIGSVVAAGRALAGAFRAAVGDAFKIGSPSRVMMDIGEDVVAGFLLGLESMPSTVAVSPLASFASGDVQINSAAAPLTGADVRSALEGLVVVLDDQAVGRVTGRRSGLYTRSEF